MYTAAWREYAPLVNFMTFAVITGIWLYYGFDQRKPLNGLIGGALAANLTVVLHLVCGYTLLPTGAFEDEGLGFLLSVRLFMPYATLFGMIVGGIAWWIMSNVLPDTHDDLPTQHSVKK